MRDNDLPRTDVLNDGAQGVARRQPALSPALVADGKA
jgi:hypothetical protein